MAMLLLCIVNGRETKRAVHLAREKVAKAINCKAKEIYFTSCGSESDNLAIKGICYKNRTSSSITYL